jgi:8-oxo-dGTP pyrophosphatase MutT (NUDIX family)
MPGGGIEPGESLRETAARELQEEVGVTGLSLIGPVWTRDHDHTWDGRAIRLTQWFFVARTSRALPAEPINLQGPDR